MINEYFEDMAIDTNCKLRICTSTPELKKVLEEVFREVARDAVEEVNKEWEKRFPCPHEDINVLTGICVICGQIVN